MSTENLRRELLENLEQIEEAVADLLEDVHFVEPDEKRATMSEDLVKVHSFLRMSLRLVRPSEGEDDDLDGEESEAAE